MYNGNTIILLHSKIKRHEKNEIYKTTLLQFIGFTLCIGFNIRLLLHIRFIKMKNLPIYLILIVSILFCVYGYFNMNITTDEKIFMFLFGNMFFSFLIMMFVNDIRQYKKEIKPHY